MQKQETFQAVESLQLENSYSVLKADHNVDLEVTVGINSDTYGWFELYDLESGGEEWYASGGLWIRNKTITDYDGVFSLPPAVIGKLKEWGYNTDEVDPNL